MNERLVIWKWTLAVTDDQAVDMPSGAQILTVQMQGELPQAWALCNPDHPKERRRIAILGTGNPYFREDDLHYISTFQMAGGTLVWHAFEVME